MSTVPEFTDRLRAAAARIRADAPGFAPDRRTDPDTPSGERWDLGQVLAHVAEMLPYWTAQVEMVLAAGGNRAPFGRVKTDPERIAAIEEDRGLDTAELLDRIDEGVDEAIMSMRRLTPGDLACTGRHSTRGVMSVSEILEDFVVGHLEEHADQLLQGADDDADDDADDAGEPAVAVGEGSGGDAGEGRGENTGAGAEAGQAPEAAEAPAEPHGERAAGRDA
jgi:hypothetical protein